MKNFIVLGTQRTGSSAITKLINSHPNILCGLEWTASKPRKKKIETASDLLSCNFKSLQVYDKEYVDIKYSENINWVGFKILFSSSDKWILNPRYSIALWFDQLSNHLNWLKSRQDTHVIHIVRNDNMDWIKSVFLAKTTKMFSEKKYPDGLKIHINVKKAISRIKSKNWVYNQIASLKFTNPYCQVEYEEFNNDKRKTATRIMHFLNCDPSLMDYSKFNAVKQSKHHAKKYILNYSQLHSALKRNDLL
jgi:LPS sulfotransferase NodH